MQAIYFSFSPPRWFDSIVSLTRVTSSFVVYFLNSGQQVAEDGLDCQECVQGFLVIGASILRYGVGGGA